MLRLLPSLILVTLLAACQSAAPQPEVRRAEAAPLASAPLSAPEGACWANDRIRAVTETRVEPVAGSAEQRVHEVVLRPAEDRLFAVPCPEQIDEAMIASLQRALAARGYYGGPISGGWDAATSEAVRRYQAPLGLDSGVLSLQAAQQMGLVAMSR